MSPRSNSYNVIVDAAEDVAIESGASHMTLDAVAAKAGVSKGGLLHHFPSKIALLEAMIKHRIQIHQEAQNKIIEVMPKGPSRELKGYILAAVNRNRDHDRLCASLSAAMAHNPKLNEPVRKVVRETYTGVCILEDAVRKGGCHRPCRGRSLAAGNVQHITLHRGTAGGNRRRTAKARR
ncbi:MAG: HTH-type transcriptional regulator SrpR [Syntrophorhabdus sp. PtaB.Bin047]|nr:MAG: HTH-type transcriptional regulator SrpR [Syntrophorhabdus sp. PtaB.Bin047]